MRATVNFRYGQTDYEFKFEEAVDKETLLKAIVLGNPPRSCKLIKDPAAIYKLEAKEVSGKHIYIEAICIGKVGGELKVAKSQLGTYESNKGYFWKTWEFDEFANKRFAETTPEAKTPETKPEPVVVAQPEPQTILPVEPVGEEDELSDLPF